MGSCQDQYNHLITHFTDGNSKEPGSLTTITVTRKPGEFKPTINLTSSGRTADIDVKPAFTKVDYTEKQLKNLIINISKAAKIAGRIDKYHPLYLLNEQLEQGTDKDYDIAVVHKLLLEWAKQKLSDTVINESFYEEPVADTTKNTAQGLVGTRYASGETPAPPQPKHRTRYG